MTMYHLKSLILFKDYFKFITKAYTIISSVFMLRI